MDGRADGEGAVCTALVEAAWGGQGRAGQADGTLLTAGRSLMVVMGGMPERSGSQPAPHCTGAGQSIGREDECILSTLQS